MQPLLKKQYLAMLIPAVILFIAGETARQFNFLAPGQFAVPGIMHTVIFILSAMAALAAPIFIRTLFAHSTQGETRVSVPRFLSFQQKILWVSMVCPYFAVAAYLCDFPRFHAGGILLMALYAVYYYYPSKKRISFDQKIFRVK